MLCLNKLFLVNRIWFKILSQLLTKLYIQKTVFQLVFFFNTVKY